MKNTFQFQTPCGPCSIINCDSDDDLTDKDLTVLLNQKNATVEPVNGKINEGSYASKEIKEGKEVKEGKEREEGKESQNRKKEQNEGNIEERGKKQPCRKIIKNPFFTNRLKFSTDLPPRPPLPPPQFFPLSGEDSKPKVCLKKKKCKKKKKSSKTESDEEYSEGGGTGGRGGKGGRGGAGGEEDEDEEEEEEECKVERDDKSCVCNKYGDEFDDRARKHCKKSRDKKANGPCRKVSESSIPPQPRRIPALLKDLPLICPKDIPEVERQIRMSQDHNLERKDCKKKCKKKGRVEQLLNL